CQLHADVPCRSGLASRLLPALVFARYCGTPRLFSCYVRRIFLSQLAARHLQFTACSAAGWKHGNHVVHERAHRTEISRLAPRERLRDGGTPHWFVSLSKLLSLRGELRRTFIVEAVNIA